MTRSGRNIGSTKLWRYISFSRFVWMLCRESLWMSRADLLGDEWEMRISRREVEAAARVIVKRDGIERTEAYRRLSAEINELRQSTFVNCWTAANFESHAMWSVYCGTGEGVAVQTALAALAENVSAPVGSVGATVETVSYDKSEMPYPFAAEQLATRKRKPFEYEQERRIIAVNTGTNWFPWSDERGFSMALSENLAGGFAMKCDTESLIKAILVHPRADESILEAVTTVTERFAPRLVDRVKQSRMAKRPPL